MRHTYFFQKISGALNYAQGAYRVVRVKMFFVFFLCALEHFVLNENAFLFHFCERIALKRALTLAQSPKEQSDQECEHKAQKPDRGNEATENTTGKCKDKGLLMWCCFADNLQKSTFGDALIYAVTLVIGILNLLTILHDFYYTSTKSWRGYIFTSVCRLLCVCLYVCLSVCLSVCLLAR